MKVVLCLAALVTSALWADEAADRAAIETTISALNTSPSPSNIFTADFPNAGELQRLREEAGPAPALLRLPQAEGVTIQTQAGTLVISREPMGEATWYPAGGVPSFDIAIAPRFVTRSVTFIAPDTAVVVALYVRQPALQAVPVLFILRRGGTDWRIASFRMLPEARTKAPF